MLDLMTSQMMMMLRSMSMLVTLPTWYKPTEEDMGEIALVGGTGDSPTATQLTLVISGIILKSMIE